MFTGIVQHLGKVLHIHSSPAGRVLEVDLGPLADRVQLGGSVAINGVCLTATAISGSAVCFDVGGETAERSNLGSLTPSETVNLELPLRATDPIDGHFVLGHVDGRAKFLRRTEQGYQCVIWCQAPDHLAAYLIPKGSIALDGVSLTIVDVQANTFSVALIPTTLAQTTLGQRKTGDMLNLEADYLAKIVLRNVGRFAGHTDDETLLKKMRSAGFID